MKKAALLLLSCVIAHPAQAQSAGTQTALTTKQIRESGGTPPVLQDGPAADGKKTLFARGIQGEVRVAGVVGADGVFRDGSIAVSSRSTELDAFALDLFARSKFVPARDKNGRALAARVTAPIFLWKDSLADRSLFAKRCDDFVLDADWHATAFPEQKPDRLRSWLLIRGASAAHQISARAKPNGGPSFDAVYAACKAKPSRKFADIYFGQ